MTKKKSVKKKSKKTNKITSKKVLEMKKLKTAKLLTTSTIIFLVSLVLYFATNPEAMKATFGFIAILAGATILLGITIEVILFLLKRAKKK
jgi:hypothetical protein